MDEHEETVIPFDEEVALVIPEFDSLEEDDRFEPDDLESEDEPALDDPEVEN